MLGSHRNPSKVRRGAAYLLRRAPHQLPSAGTVGLEDFPEAGPGAVAHLETSVRQKMLLVSLRKSPYGALKCLMGGKRAVLPPMKG